MPTVITAERPDTVEAMELITELDAYLVPLYPPESHHGLSVDKLLQEAVAFFVLRHEQVPAGCGGIKLFETEYGDVKRMYVWPQFRGFGFGKRVLHYLATYALQQGVKVLRLETGICQVEAIGLYERCGFQRIPPFGAYKDDPRPRRAMLASLAVDICAPQHFRRTLKESTIRLSQRAIGHATDMPQKMHSEPPYADGPT